MVTVPRDIQDLAALGVVVSMVTRNERLTPCLMDGMGLQFSEDGSQLAIFVADKWYGPTLDNARANGRIAVTFCRPITFQAVQVKGLFRECRSMTAADNAVFAAWLAQFKQELLSTGHSRESIGALKFAATHAVVIDVTDVFLQTPGPRAGERAT